MSMVRIDQDLYDRVRAIAEKNGRTIKDIIEDAIKLYVLGVESVDRDIKDIKHRWISVQYRTSCYRCKKTIDVGEVAYYIRYKYSDGSSKSFVYCSDCYFSSSGLAKLYIKKKELEAVIKGLKKEADRLAEEVSELQKIYDILNLKKDLMDFWRNVREIFSQTSDISKVNEFFDRLAELVDRVSSIEATIPFEYRARKAKVSRKV